MKTVLKFDAGGRTFKRVVYLTLGLAIAFLLFGVYFLVAFLRQGWQ